MTTTKRYLNFGCGIFAPVEWENYDVSPTLQIRKIPLIGKPISKLLHDIPFPDHVKVGNIVKGLPVANESIDVIYSSHVIEHMSYEDAQKAIANVFAHLKPGGVFRSVLPDLEVLIKEYINSHPSSTETPANIFMRETLLGLEQRPKGMLRKIISIFGNYHHLWMWDFESLSHELRKAGFINIKRSSLGDSNDRMFDIIEDPSRFIKALYIEAIKPLA